MNIGILGSGPVAGRLADLARLAGHAVVVGSRTDAEAAAQHADVLILAIPYLACAEALP